MPQLGRASQNALGIIQQESIFQLVEHPYNVPWDDAMGLQGIFTKFLTAWLQYFGTSVHTLSPYSSTSM
ncbi:MAG: hypothetical protein WDN75_16870 [Bacteroidota bacterium]